MIITSGAQQVLARLLHRSTPLLEWSGVEYRHAIVGQAAGPSSNRRRPPSTGGEPDVLPHRRAAAARLTQRSAEANKAPGGSMGTVRPSKSDAQQAGRPVSRRPQQAAPAVSESKGSPGGSSPEPYPTFVPRPAGVTDGPWNRTDQSMVLEAESDAQQAVRPERIDQAGFVLLGKSMEELEGLVERMGAPRFRARQILEALLQGARSLEDIQVLPKDLRAKLTEAGVRTGRSIQHGEVSAPDGTRKFLLQLHDGRVVETVGIPNDEAPTPRDSVGRGTGSSTTAAKGGRLTVCVSSQVGCPMRCSFCATGKGGFARNLLAHEIMDQVLSVQEAYGRRVSNVVFMGMGEPLLNLPAVTSSYRLLNEQMGIGGRYITVSTVGVPNSIPRLAQANLRSTLAVSIHAPNQALRESLIPSAKAYPLSALMEDCTTYFKITGRRVTFEYTLLSGINDAPSHARELGELLRSHNLISHVNLIPWNPVDESEFVRPSRNRIFSFQRELEEAGLTTTIRITRGLEAAAACGQLRNMHQKVPLAAFAVPA